MLCRLSGGLHQTFISGVWGVLHCCSCCCRQVALEGAVNAKLAASSLARGELPQGDLIPWTIGQQYQVRSLPGSCCTCQHVQQLSRPALTHVLLREFALHIACFCPAVSSSSELLFALHSQSCSCIRGFRRMVSFAGTSLNPQASVHVCALPATFAGPGLPCAVWGARSAHCSAP